MKTLQSTLDAMLSPTRQRGKPLPPCGKCGTPTANFKSLLCNPCGGADLHADAMNSEVRL